MRHTILYRLLLLSLAAPLNAQQAYYPLAVGNRWDYGYLDAPQHVGFVYSHSATVVRDAIMPNGKTYAVYRLHERDTYLRQEENRVLAWNGSADVVYYDFDVQEVDTVNYSVDGGDTILTIVGVGSQTLFGRERKTWTYATVSLNNPHFESGWWTVFDGIGYGNSFQSPGYNEYLIGAIIDGKTYGTITSVEGFIGGHETPIEFALYQNYPNPFNPSTTITYELPKSSVARLSVYDMLGREVSVLVNERRDAGVHEVTFDAAGLASGVYFYRITAGSYVDTKKLLLVR